MAMESASPATGDAEALLRAGMVAALTHIDAVGFHGIATSITRPSPVAEPGWAGLIRNARSAVASVGWPEALRPGAAAFVKAAGDLAQKLDEGDLAAGNAPAKALHVAYHALSDAGWAHLSATAGFGSPSQSPEAHSHHHPSH